MDKRHENYNFRSILKRAADNWGDKYGWIFDEGKKKYTFNEINKNVEDMEKVLTKQGISKGNKIALMLPNIPEFPLTWLASGYIGAVIVPLSYHAQQYDASYILNQTEVNIIITTNDKVSLLNDIKNSNELTFKIITVDSYHELADHYLNDLLSALPNEAIQINEESYPESLVNIQYTSGTTGSPKGCMLTQYYWINIGNKIIQKPFPGLDDTDTILTAQPFYYMDPQWNTMASLISGATLVVLDRFSPSVFWDKVRKYKVTFFYCLGSMPALMLKMPRSAEEKNHSVKYIGCSAIPPKLHRELEERWGVPWFEIFGMTETGYDISMTVDEQVDYVGTGALGRPVIDREIRIVDEHFRNVEREKVGELVLRGKGLMDGYYKNEEATNQVFTNGWFKTGDLAKMDKEGILYLVGRKKDMIRRSGENISATEVEDVLMSHDEVKIAACIPVEDDLRGEEIKAYIVPTNNIEDFTSFSLKLSDYCEGMLAKFKIPRYWELVDKLPTTPSERIAKHVLAQEKDDLTIGAYDRVQKTVK